MFNWIFSGIIGWMLDIVLGLFQGMHTLLADVFTMDLETFDTVFPVAKTTMNVVEYAAIGIMFMIIIFQLLKMLMGPMASVQDSPVRLVSMGILAGVLIFNTRWFFDYIVFPFLEIPYYAMGQAEGARESDVSADSLASIKDAFDGLGSEVSGVTELMANIISLALFIMIAWNYLKLMIEIAERYVVMGVLTYTAPLAFSLMPSKATSNSFSAWVRMVASQGMMLFFNSWFMAMIDSAIFQFDNGVTFGTSGSDTMIWALTVLGLLKVGQRIDTYMGMIGLNAAPTGIGPEIVGGIRSAAHGIGSVASGMTHLGRAGVSGIQARRTAANNAGVSFWTGREKSGGSNSSSASTNNNRNGGGSGTKGADTPSSSQITADLKKNNNAGLGQQNSKSAKNTSETDTNVKAQDGQNNPAGDYDEESLEAGNGLYSDQETEVDTEASAESKVANGENDDKNTGDGNLGQNQAETSANVTSAHEGVPQQIKANDDATAAKSNADSKTMSERDRIKANRKMLNKATGAGMLYGWKNNQTLNGSRRNFALQRGTPSATKSNPLNPYGFSGQDLQDMQDYDITPQDMNDYKEAGMKHDDFVQADSMGESFERYAAHMAGDEQMTTNDFKMCQELGISTNTCAEYKKMGWTQKDFQEAKSRGMSCAQYERVRQTKFGEDTNKKMPKEPTKGKNNSSKNNGNNGNNQKGGKNYQNRNK